MKNAKKQLMTQLLILGTCGALTLAACAPTVAQRGNMLEDFQIESVKAGESTRSDVLRALGSPTTKSPFDERTWYYIGQETEKRGILDPEVVKERIIVVNFDAEGFVVSINEAKNGRVHAYSDALEQGPEALELVLARNLYGTIEDVSPDVLQAMAAYVRANIAALSGQSMEDIVNNFEFLPLWASEQDEKEIRNDNAAE